MAFTNDRAKRSVALINNFSGHLTKYEDPMRFALNGVSDHLNKLPNALKRIFVGSNKCYWSSNHSADEQLIM